MLDKRKTVLKFVNMLLGSNDNDNKWRMVVEVRMFNVCSGKCW